jgi:hypothetical protein
MIYIYKYIFILAITKLKTTCEAKDVGGYYIIKLHHKTKVHLLFFSKFYISN